MSRFILASKSPRRKELLQPLCSDFECIPAKGDEVFHEGSIDEVLMEVASAKALEIAAAHADADILGADTIVVDGEQILQKPKTRQEAFETLRQLSGRWHAVKTGMVLIHDGDMKKTVETTLVHFRNLADEEIRAYVEEGSCLDKAGSYGIQDVDFVDRIEGSFSNVVGLPTERLKEWLADIR